MQIHVDFGHFVTLSFAGYVIQPAGLSLGLVAAIRTTTLIGERNAVYEFASLPAICLNILNPKLWSKHLLIWHFKYYIRLPSSCRPQGEQTFPSEIGSQCIYKANGRAGWQNGK